MLRAKAKELGGMIQTGETTSTKLDSQKFLGSTTAELILVKILNSSAQRTSFPSRLPVKVHARNIYAKLAVTNRTQAVAKGRALGILSHT